MCDSEAEKILFILNKHERAYRRLIPVYIFLAIVLWILPILLIVYLYFCIVDNEFLRIGFCIAWTAYYFLSLFKYFVKYFFPLDREDLLKLMDLGFAPIFPDTCYHLTHYWLAAVDIPVASDNPVHYADAIRYNARTPLQGSLLPLTRLVWA
ncbi:hypothetical protein G967_04717 [Escherichia coli UMEA 3329-1]|nr:hypothetical protein G967_04717 [Escherichia coli UMEA 3329-1]